jgi:hypothetical protein
VFLVSCLQIIVKQASLYWKVIKLLFLKVVLLNYTNRQKESTTNFHPSRTERIDWEGPWQENPLVLVVLNVGDVGRYLTQ